jgi:hypothetical protein
MLSLCFRRWPARERDHVRASALVNLQRTDLTARCDIRVMAERGSAIN